MKRHIAPIAFLIPFLLVVNVVHAQDSVSAPKDVIIVLDGSSSMETSDPQLLRNKMALRILYGLSGDSHIGFVTFTNKSELVMPLTAVTEANIGEKTKEILGELAKTKPEITATVTLKSGDTLWDLAEKYYGNPYKWNLIQEWNKITGDGTWLPVGTVIEIPSAGGASPTRETEGKDLPGAVEMAFYELKQNGRKNAEKQIILVSDGIIDVEDDISALEKYKRLADELTAESKAMEIRIFTIALAEAADSEFMNSLAQKTDGGYYQVLKGEDIQTAFSNINKIKSAPQTTTDVKMKPVLTKPTTPSKEKGTLIWGLTLFQVLMLGGGVVVIALAVIAYVFVMRRKKSGADKVASIPGAYLMDLDNVTEKSNYTINSNIVKIGRAGNDDVDIPLDVTTVSNTHAQIEYKNNGFYLSDLGSTNGTYLNDEGEKITGKVRIKAGDVISFDQHRFKFVVRGQGDRISASKSSPTGSKSGQFSGVSSVSNIDSARNPENTATDSEVAGFEAYLEDASGVTDKKSHKIARKVVKIGRVKRRDIDIFIDKNTVSAAHAQIEYKDNSFYLSDLGSRNGTYLNEERDRITSEVRLSGNDVIYFDQYKFKFVMHGQGEHKKPELSSLADKAVSN